MMELVDFLRERLSEDEAAARAAMRSREAPVPAADHWESDERARGGYVWISGTHATVVATHRPVGPHIARHDPARVLAEVEAKRRIVDEHPRYDDFEPCCRTCDSDDGSGSLVGEWPCATLRLLALPYDEHPEFSNSWRV